jgi:subtilase family serine protease
VVVDPANELPESDENNNRRDLTLPDIPMPDIAITDLRTYPSTNLSPGMSIQLIATLHNFGGATERGFVLHFSAANFSQQVWINGMEANEDKEVEVTWWNIPPGQHRLVATVDPQNVVPETNKANNQATSTVDVSAPDLIAESYGNQPCKFRFWHNGHCRRDREHFRCRSHPLCHSCQIVGQRCPCLRRSD